MINNNFSDSVNNTDKTQEVLEEEVFVFPLSFSQENIWLLEQFREEKAIYNLAGALHLKGQLQIPSLQEALAEIVARHEILRTTFPLMDGNPVQAIAPSLELPMATVDLQGMPKTQQWDEVQNFMEREIHHVFDLAKGPLWQVILIKLNSESHIVFLNMHHIISDGWSVGIFLQELSELYGAFLKNSPSPLSDIEIQYGDFAEWQRQWLTGEVLERQLDYWQQQLIDAPGMINLPTDFPRPPKQTFQGAHQELNLTPSLTASLQSFTQQKDVSLFVTLLTGLKILLAQLTQQRDLVVGTVIAGRSRPEIEPLIGCFINFLALRSNVSEQQTAQEFLEQVNTTFLDAYSYPDCPFEKVVEVLNPSRDISHNPIYNVGLLLQNFPLSLQFDESLEAYPLPLEMGTSLLDLRFEVFVSSDRTCIRCEYRTDLFEAKTIKWLLADYQRILEQLVEQTTSPISQFKISEELKVKAQKATTREQKSVLAIASTFTSEPIKECISFWFREFDLPFEIKFAPYNQVFQELLNPASLMATNNKGINVILLRLEDWGKNKNHLSLEPKKNLQDLAELLKSSSERSSTPYLICCCPASPQAIADSQDKELYQQLEHELCISLEQISGVTLTTISELMTLYPVEDYYDANSDKLGHIPYTPMGFTGLGTFIARKIQALKRQPYKVIALDCDQTLWKGICGEDGAEGVEITPAHQALQEFMLTQQKQGKILCMCSKNQEEDVFAVFEAQKTMPLKREHFVSWRINWQPKSENIKSLAQELQVGLDSFILVEDNPVECAEVQANCPEVLTVLLPKDYEQVPQFLEHIWAFDSLKVTKEDQVRTQRYQQNTERERLRQKTLTFEDFLTQLGLQVGIEPCELHQFARVAQLTQRTNQFNLTTIRRSEIEIQQLCESGQLECLVVSVKDRFGDYGLVGVILFESAKELMAVDTFLLSCRALGRGVEYQMLAQLGIIAQERGFKCLEVPCLFTEKNQPAQDFLVRVGEQYKQDIEKGWLFRFSVGEIVNLTFKPDSEAMAATKNSSASSFTTTKANQSHSQLILYQRIGTQLYTTEQILSEIDSQKQWQQRETTKTFVEPRNSIEVQLAGIWREVLKIEHIGIYDNFFELGGASLIAVRLMAKIQQEFGKQLPLSTLFESPTIEKLGAVLQEQSDCPSWSSLVPIQSHGSKLPLFCIPGVGGNVIYLQLLAQYLGSDQPFYGLQSVGLDGISQPHTSVEEMATHYIQVVRSVQPEGPYRLGGHSFGGRVAFEMTQQLEKQGEIVEILAIFDIWAPYAEEETMGKDWNGARWSLEIVKVIQRLSQTEINVSQETFEKLTSEEQLGYITQLLQKVKLLPPGADSRQVKSFCEVFKTNCQMCYLPQISQKLSQTQILLFQAEEIDPEIHQLQSKAPEIFQDPTWGWQKFCKRPVVVAKVPGAHITMMANPFVKSLADHLKVCLRQN